MTTLRYHNGRWSIAELCDEIQNKHKRQGYRYEKNIFMTRSKQKLHPAPMFVDIHRPAQPIGSYGSAYYAVFRDIKCTSIFLLIKQ